MAQQAPRPFITCHVLETVAGRPAANMAVSLTLISPTPSSASNNATFTATTNSDGRVTAWSPSPSSSSSSSSTTRTTTTTTLEATIEDAKKQLGNEEQMVWSIRFQTGEFYGAGKTFWPEVELRFFTALTELHYHVPLLLGPWSYTTYRGS
ncbi:hypothetical protein AAFC00_007198 [Neodothiora populina]|uniref:5-hydroxyisourate hydrolase n=1 Tax=Neodothiora populina TaxID=2781224 RepID=A0ABR3PHH6_9PEZI